MTELREKLVGEMERADFAAMDVIGRYNFISEFIMRECRGDIEAARKSAENKRQAYYLSAEFLVGRLIYSNLYNLGLLDDVATAMNEVGCDIREFEEIPDAALGNGGLGRLAACFLDSAATHDIPLNGYGIYYRYGLFRQDLSEGYQREKPDDWTRVGDPWSIRRDSEAVEVVFDSRTSVMAVPYDLPVFGYSDGKPKIGSLRLWQAEAKRPFDFKLFDEGKYAESVADAEFAGRISAVLYPNDNTRAGRELRLRQQYFFTSASVKDILRRFDKSRANTESIAADYRHLPELAVMQLNDTHPVLAVPELILRLTERGVAFRDALEIASRMFAYTNHTVMGEALEVWDAALMKSVIPDVYAVICDIQRELEYELTKIGAERGRMDIIDNGYVHMARLASFVAFAINGVAALHTEILKHDVLHRWYKIYPHKFSNKTNGITQRRWLGLANPGLARFITERIGDGWICDLDELEKLKRYADDKASLEEFANIKTANKLRLAKAIESRCGIRLSPEFMFDIQAKRLHEYKRQLLNAFSILDLYFGIKDGAIEEFTPTAFIFGAKSAPGYARAKGIIRYILAIADLINNDPELDKLMKVVFVPDYNVSWGELFYPAGDLSEQISTAGTEASGTGNMKFMLNGALTLGTYDGANIEILESAGSENNYFFGLRAEKLAEKLKKYDPREVYRFEPRIRRVVDTLAGKGSIKLSDGGCGIFAELYKSLLEGASWHRADNYYLLGDFYDYTDAKRQANLDYQDKISWAKKGFMNTVNAGRFSSDRTVKEYARDIWRV
ncbi:MAG: glycogen/starch/alpha-glucan phosphorylase [Clostridiales bacterium]|nr:glycogen/starch/alpha-glucan phosphorylase [Clostridiales bacterium]